MSCLLMLSHICPYSYPVLGKNLYTNEYVAIKLVSAHLPLHVISVIH